VPLVLLALLVRCARARFRGWNAALRWFLSRTKGGRSKVPPTPLLCRLASKKFDAVKLTTSGVKLNNNVEKSKEKRTRNGQRVRPFA
jgi:hypothetical protein